MGSLAGGYFVTKKQKKVSNNVKVDVNGKHSNISCNRQLSKR